MQLLSNSRTDISNDLVGTLPSMQITSNGSSICSGTSININRIFNSYFTTNVSPVVESTTKTSLSGEPQSEILNFCTFSSRAVEL